MRLWAFIFLSCVVATVYSEDVKWDKASILKADIDCDGIPDVAKIGYLDRRVRLSVTLGASKKTEFLDFGLGDSMAQDSLCGTKATLTIENIDYDLSEELCDNPEGFKRSMTCKGLNVRGEQCDSIHIYWNHVKKRIDWWRL